MENKIKNPVSKKNIFFFNIFDRLINSIEKYVHKTEEDTFAENFDILKEDSVITVSPKGSIVEKLVLGDGYSALKIDDGNFIAHVDINNEDGIVELYSRRNNKEARTMLDNKSIYYGFDENYIATGGVKFDKNGIAVTTNNTTYEIYEAQLSTIVNACEYSYDEYNSTYVLNLFPNAEEILSGDATGFINFFKDNTYNSKLRISEEGVTSIICLANNNNGLDYISEISMNFSSCVATVRNNTNDSFNSFYVDSGGIHAVIDDSSDNVALNIDKETLQKIINIIGKYTEIMAL